MTLTMSYAIAGLMQGAADPAWPAKMTGISSLVIALSMLAIAAMLVGVALVVRGLTVKVNAMMERITGEIEPIAHRLRSVADTAERISTTVQTDVERVSRTINEANDGVRDALAVSERRLKEFDALLHVVQHEAEEAIVTAAATVRGVRAVAAAFGDEALDALELDDDDYDDDYDLEDDRDEEDIDDGDDTGDIAGGAEPRIRSRYGRGGRTRGV